MSKRPIPPPPPAVPLPNPRLRNSIPPIMPPTRPPATLLRKPPPCGEVIGAEGAGLTCRDGPDGVVGMGEGERGAE